MKRTLAGIGLIVLFRGLAICQSDAAKPAFDAADVRLSPRSDWVKDGLHAMQVGFVTSDRYELRKATMLDLIRTAYNVEADKVVGGPSWLDYDRFDIAGKTKSGTRPETLRQMLQTVLADRFSLVVKKDTRQVPGYVLSMGKRDLKLKPVPGGAVPAGCRLLGRAFEGDMAYSSIQCRNVTMGMFAEALHQLASAPLRNLPVADSTGLEGGWDFDFRYAQRVGSPDAPADAGVIDELDKLGLKLALGQVPQPVLTVQSVNQRPTPNPREAAALPPLPPPEFEVASVKPCKGERLVNPQFEAGGRVTATCAALGALIVQVWNLNVFDEPAGMPKWLTEDPDSHRISIEAKAPLGVAVDPQRNAEARDLLNAMLRSLLIDRFKMKVHYEDRPMDAPTLVAVKPKLTKAVPANRTGCTREIQPPQGRTVMVRMVCRNVTMAQFAEQIPAYDLTLIYPVLDNTGLDGAWDFSINYDWATSALARFPQPASATAAASGEASEPSGSLSFAEAVEKQLGLKLKMEKRPAPVFVIDHVEEKPSEN